ncbi:MAG: hypothetical protein QOG62_1385 [Thermoleophilaceae bacterium]|jgi:PAS domain S-box-containing protein|nr:hypothetical protein [Thermoleophilaceae bacterium]
MTSEGLLAEETQDQFGEVLEPVIPLLLAGSYVLTDPRGAITGWGVQAEALFGLTIDDVRGRPLTATLTGSDHGEDPVSLLVNDSRLVAAHLDIDARDRNGDTRACALSVVPIDLRHGLAFSGLIRDLEAASVNEGQAALREAHQGVLHILGATLAGEEPVESDGRLAGVMVIVSPLDDVEWLTEARTTAVRSRSGSRRPPAGAVDDEDGGAAAAAERLVHTGEVVGRLDEVAHTADEALRRSMEAAADFAGLYARVEDLAVRMSELQASLSEQRGPSSDPEADAGLRTDLEGLLAATNDAQVRAERATSESEAARAAAEAAAAAATGAQARAEEAALQVAAASRELSEAGDRLARGAQPARVNGISRNTKSGREPIPGFDDASTPRAQLDLDGRYRLLNDSFAELVGFSEQQFRSASWPSLIDRDNRESHGALHAEIREGRRDDAQVQTFYTGGAGLLVEVSGRVSLVRDAAGEPAHLLFELDQG